MDRLGSELVCFRARAQGATRNPLPQSITPKQKQDLWPHPPSPLLLSAPQHTRASRLTPLLVLLSCPQAGDAGDNFYIICEGSVGLLDATDGVEFKRLGKVETYII